MAIFEFVIDCFFKQTKHEVSDDFLAIAIHSLVPENEFLFNLISDSLIERVLQQITASVEVARKVMQVVLLLDETSLRFSAVL
jgi:hypothetical protein